MSDDREYRVPEVRMTNSLLFGIMLEIYFSTVIQCMNATSRPSVVCK